MFEKWLRGLLGFAGAKVQELFEITKQFPHFFSKKFILQLNLPGAFGAS